MFLGAVDHRGQGGPAEVVVSALTAEGGGKAATGTGTGTGMESRTGIGIGIGTCIGID
ncbi:hypothetical protein [Streptomyces sp. DSM 40484]|uniref:hypothetical protein n=1 Tax=Streptomyces kroppenstedtii TaxID=3051181 RepID=UPI0028D23E4D|nr:hypothetical protein [Streptomyces sp. DSM 40484]